MSAHEKEWRDIEPIDDFVTLVIDGAYVHFSEGFLSLLFFIDKQFPSHDKVGEVSKTRLKREILHEVRMAIPIANTLTEDLQEGLDTYAQFGFLIPDRDFWKTHKLKDSEEVVTYKQKRSKLDDIAWVSFTDMFRNCTKKGQEEMTEIITQCLHENIDKIRKISEKYAKDKKKVYKINDRK